MQNFLFHVTLYALGVMRKFKFRLQGLEDIKGMELDALKQECAAAQTELHKSEHDLIEARAALDSTYAEIGELRRLQADPLILLSMESYTGVLREQIKALSQKVATQRNALAETREKLAGKHKEKKVLEKYHEKKFTEYSQLIEREMQKELDETAGNRHQLPGTFGEA